MLQFKCSKKRLFVHNCIVVSRMKNGRCPNFYINHCSAPLQRNFNSSSPLFLSTCNCIYFDFVYLYLFKAIYICLLLSIWVYVNNSSYSVDRKKGSIERKVSIFWQLEILANLNEYCRSESLIGLLSKETNVMTKMYHKYLRFNSCT